MDESPDDIDHLNELLDIMGDDTFLAYVKKERIPGKDSRSDLRMYQITSLALKHKIIETLAETDTTVSPESQKAISDFNTLFGDLHKRLEPVVKQQHRKLIE